MTADYTQQKPDTTLEQTVEEVRELLGRASALLDAVRPHEKGYVRLHCEDQLPAGLYWHREEVYPPESYASFGRDVLPDADILDLALNLKRPEPHQCIPVLLTGSKVHYRRFRSGGDSAHVNAEDLILVVRAALARAAQATAASGAAGNNPEQSRPAA